MQQLHIAKKLHDQGFNPILEYKIKSTTQKTKLGRYKRYKADIIADGYVWEVKPLLGKDPKKQLELYRTEGNLKLGMKLEPISNIPIINDIKMKITFPDLGEARYGFYREKDGEEVYVPSAEVRKEYMKRYYYSHYLLEKLLGTPLNFPHIPGLPVPIPGPAPVPVPAI